MQPFASPAERLPSCAAVWAPWLAAPLFALLPIGGCGLAGGWRPAVAGLPAAVAAPAAPVLTVVPVASRRVARGATAH